MMRKYYDGVLIEDDTAEMPLEQPSEAVAEYRRFMADSNNSHKCAGCPANQDMESGIDNRFPCGQFHCWVDLH